LTRKRVFPVPSCPNGARFLISLKGEGEREANLGRQNAVPPTYFRFPFLAVICSLLSAVVPSLSAAETIEIIPAQFTMHGPHSRQTLVVERRAGGRFQGQMTNAIQFTSSNPSVVTIEDGTAVPVGDGVATITAKTGGRTAKATITVADMARPMEWSFRNDVQPVLAKAGCSSGACHGAAAGQGGFKLSLRGYNDEGDYQAITRQALGRRLVPSDPGRSLVLLKPTSAIAHKGGQRFDPESLEYKILSEWIAEGAQGPAKDEARIVRIEILPDLVVLGAGASQQLMVRAHFSDGRVQDVTRWAKYTDANAAVTQVDETGKVKVMGHGQGAITAWYLSRIALATVTVPFTNKVPSQVWAKAPRRNFLDELILEKLRDLNLQPSSRCTDEDFLRRAFLDTVGVLPTADEARTFLASTSPRKRDELIEALLRRPEFVDYWAHKWSDLLLVNGDRLAAPAMWSFYNWIRNQVAANTPWDKFVRQIVTARGSTLENGAANYFVLHDDPTLMAETTTIAFMGLAVTCAKCHNHPMEKWTNDEYFGFANLFARVRSKNGPTDGDRIIFAASSGDIIQPLTGKPQAPRPLDGKPLRMEDTSDRREAMADWLVSPSNPYFGRTIVNRVWANFFGVGLVEAVDDLRMTNPASNEKLLSAAAAYLAAQKYDLKALMRLILQSEAYQRSSQPVRGSEADTRFYSHFYPRRLAAEVLLDAMSEVTAVPTRFRVDARNRNTTGKEYPIGWRALQLPDSNVDSYFLKSFGRSERVATCECERTSEPSMAQALHIANGDTLNEKLTAKENSIQRLLARNLPPEKMIEEAWLSSVSRYPTAAEATRLLKVLKDADENDRRAVVEDIFWSLLSSREFLFNH
jgi:hypothetical protein